MTKRAGARGWWTLIVGCVVGLGTAQSLAQSCEPMEGIESICGLMAPEDIVRAPNGRDLIFSQFGEDGRLSLLDTRDQSVHTLFPGSDSTVATDELWGDASCTSPVTSIAPHGIGLSQRRDGRWQLLVVNHSQRESVEIFELVEDGQARARLIWRGCAVAPAQSHLNDVAALPGGGFLATQMYGDDAQWWMLVKVLFGVDTGYVYRWQQASGFEVVPGTGGKLPNGITMAPDGKSYFVNVYLDNELRKYDLASGELVGRVSINKPDNHSWSLQGRLLVASHPASLLQIMSSLDDGTGAPSALPFVIVEVDPETLETRVVLQREGAPMGAGTVAVEHGGYLYIGSYVGDRMIKVPLPVGL